MFHPAKVANIWRNAKHLLKNFQLYQIFAHKKPPLFNGYRLGQIARLVNILALADGYVISQQLKGNGGY